MHCDAQTKLGIDTVCLQVKRRLECIHNKGCGLLCALVAGMRDL